MDSLDGEPYTDILPPDVWMHDEDRREILHSAKSESLI